MIHNSIKDSLKFASIDIGSNAMRLLFCRVIEDNTATTYIKESLIRMPLRLGQDAFTIGEISEDNLKIELDNIQELTNEYVNKLNQIQENKEKEILE